MIDPLLTKIIGSMKHKKERKIKNLMAKGMTYEDAYKSVYSRTGKQYMLNARAMRKNEFIQPDGYKFTPQGTLVKKANLEGDKTMKFKYHTESEVEKTAEAKTDKKKKKIDFGLLSVKAGIDNNPKATKADMIVGAKMNKKAYAKDSFTPHMMFHGDKSKKANTYEEHINLKKKGWGHEKVASTKLTKSVLKHLKSGKGIKSTAKKLKVDEDLVVETARNNINAQTTARAITKEKNKGLLAKTMDVAAGRSPVRDLKAKAKASGGESKKVIKNALGKKQFFSPKGSIPTPKVKIPEVKAEIVKVPSNSLVKVIEQVKKEKAPSMLDRAKKYLTQKQLVAGGIAAGGAGGYVMGKNAAYDPTSTEAGAEENSEFLTNRNIQTGDAIDRLVNEWISRKVPGVRKESPVVIVKEI